ncbi:MAG: hypothetical protein A2521_16690 [Deltaproteobacteria bacterium RIFOXYD12_FULL_57_12]|nr:MAG: hypothetical protein A2521_16690 [Deltaproteobacteria bacterium RIFOXYD12_FULL_57_12]
MQNDEPGMKKRDFGPSLKSLGQPIHGRSGGFNGKVPKGPYGGFSGCGKDGKILDNILCMGCFD